MGSEYASELLKLFYCGCKRDTQGRLIYTDVITGFTPNLDFSSYSGVIYSSMTLKLIKG